MKSFLSFSFKILLWVLSPLSFLYQVLFWIDRRRTKPRKLTNCYVISVGNLTVGGTGKTPFVQFLIRDLKNHFPDFHFTILSRGYKARLSLQGALVESNASPMDVGDEPLLHKQTFPDVQVIIGSDRFQSYQTFNQYKSSKHVVILDDGFQHHKLYRDFEIVLLDANHLLGNGFTLPLGSLRETRQALLRAHAVVFTKWNEENAEKVDKFESNLDGDFKRIPRYHSKFTPELDAKQESADMIRSYFLVTGVGNPESVMKSAKQLLGSKVIAYKYFSDHYSFQEKDMHAIIADLPSSTALLLTEKDWVKVSILTNFLNEAKEKRISIFLIKIKLEMEELQQFNDVIVSRVSSYVKENALD
ncbi:tetraacyldisaccharide 4'-kinase [Leptospira ognonensis]|uniref:tetraacyldisaccharide 4'-kinase n=1 Tax=Leptospira ognonensis TaxID=2484945 RepID=UPI00143849BF|nr:tetraacyldisaccharide 4'-kinase [Leptospira ognonensis]